MLILHNKKPKNWLLINFAIITIIIVAYAYLVQIQFKFVKNSSKEQLSSIADLKSNAISNWYEDQVNDLMLIAQSEILAKDLNQYTKSNDQDELKNLNSFLSTIKVQHNYSNLLLIDQELNELVTDEIFQLSLSELYPIIEESRQTKKGIATNILSNEALGFEYICFIHPVLDINNNINAFLISINDVNANFYKDVEHWPIPTKTSKAYLFECVNNSINYYYSGGINRQTSPIDNLVVERFIQQNLSEKFAKTINSEGNRAWVYLKKIENTPWYLILTTNYSEIFNNQRLLIFSNLAIIIVLLIITYILIAYLNSIKQRSSQRRFIEEQNEYIKTLNSIGEGVVSIDLQSRIKYINKVYTKITGLSNHDSVDHHINDKLKLYSFDEESEIEISFEYFFANHQKGNFNSKLLLKSNLSEALIPIDISGYPILNDDNEIKGGVIILRDQSKEQKLLQQLKEYSSQLDYLLSNLPGVAYKCKINKDYNFTYVSDRIFELTGYKSEDFTKKMTINFGQLIDKEYQDYVWDSIQLAIKENDSYVFEYPIITKTNQKKWVWEQGVPLYDDKGNLVGLGGIILDISGRKRSEQELAKTQNLYKTLTLNSAIGICRLDINGTFIYTNPQLSAITGYKMSDLLGKPVLRFVSQNDKRKFSEITTSTSPENINIDINVKIKNPNGHSVWIRALILPEFDLQNKHIGYTGNIIDVSKQYETDSKLQNSQQLLRTVIDNIPDNIYMKDLKGRKTLSNKVDYEQIGLKSEEEILYKNDYELFPSELADQYWKDDQQVLTTGTPILNVEQKSIDYKNRTFYSLVSKIPYRNEENKIIGLIGINRNITELKKAESQNQLLQKAITQIPISVIITSVQKGIEYVNKHFTETYGYKLDEIIGKKDTMINTDLNHPDILDIIETKLSAGQIWVGELQNRVKNGSIIWENVTIAPIFRNNSLSKYILLKEDITPKKELMKELTIAKEKAEQSDRLKTSFLANMSHEIRTPLNAILGFTRLIYDEDLEKEEKSYYVNIIDRSAETLVQIINDIIDISSIETGTIKIHKSPVDINSMLETVHKQFDQRLKTLNESNSTIIVTVKEPITLTIDENRISQVFINLISNAIKFTQNGKIEFGVFRISDDKIEFIVKDNGIGIGSEHHQTIFERFRQADDNNTRKYGGNGLGLPIVKNLIELHDGKIWVNSELGKGSVFHFTLPNR